MKEDQQSVWQQLEAARKRLEIDDYDVSIARSDSLRASVDVGAGKQPQRRVLVVDDDEGFREGLKAEALKMKADVQGQRPFHVDAMDATEAMQVVQAIEAAHRNQQAYDVLLLDYELRGDEFTAKEVLAALNASNNPVVKFLPRLAITSHWSKGESLTATLLGLGADGVHLHKGHTAGANDSTVKTNFQQVLDTLQVSEFFEMRARAWGRMWRMARHRLEHEIASQRLQPCPDEETYLKQLSQVWHVVFELMTKSGYAGRANLRVFIDGQLQSVEPVDEALRQSGLTLMPWDQLPYVKGWLESAIEDWKVEIDQLVPKFTTYCLNQVDTGNLGQEQRLNNLLLNKRVIGMPLFTHHGPIGVFTLVREPSDTAFGLTDWEQMLTVGLRLAQHAQELRQRWLDHDRQQALVALSGELDKPGTEQEMLERASKVVHNSMFQHVQGLRGAASLPPQAGLDTGGRTTLRMLLADGRTTGCGMGLGFRDGQVHSLGDDPRPQSAWLVQTCIAKLEPAFFPDSAMVPGYAASSPGINKSLMLAPLKVNGVGAGALAVGHRTLKYFGESQTESADFFFLQRCAELLGQALQRRRESRLVGDVLDLLLDISDESAERVDDSHWPSQVARMLAQHLVACRAVVWLRPPDSHGEAWLVRAAWDAEPLTGAPLLSADEARIERWNRHLIANWQSSFTSQSLGPGPLVRFTDKEFLQDDALGVHTKSQLNLRIAMTPQGPTLAVMVLLFTVARPFDYRQNHEFLQRMARLCALFVQDRERVQQLGTALSVARRNKGLADAYAQMRHQIRTQLGSLDEAFKRSLRELARSQADPVVTTSIEELQRRWLENLPGLHQGLDASALFTREPNLAWFSLNDMFDEVAASPMDRAQHLGVTVTAAVALDVEIFADRDIIKLVIANFIDNALDEFSMQRRSESGRGARSTLSERPAIEVSWVPQTAGFSITVADNGPGVLPAMEKLLFTGKSNKPKGGGFQLRFSKDRLSDLGLDLTHERNRPQGAVFRIAIPSSKVRHSPTNEARKK